MNWNKLSRNFNHCVVHLKNNLSNQFHRNIVLPYFFFTGNGQSTTPCPIWKPNDGKRNMILISLIVVTLVLVVICIAYLVLFGFQKYLINTHREEQIYVNQIITAWFRHRTDEWNHKHEQSIRFSNYNHRLYRMMNLFLKYA